MAGSDTHDWSHHPNCAEALLNGRIARFDVLDDITSDRGPAFTSQLWAAYENHGTPHHCLQPPHKWYGRMVLSDIESRPDGPLHLIGKSSCHESSSAHEQLQKKGSTFRVRRCSSARLSLLQQKSFHHALRQTTPAPPANLPTSDVFSGSTAPWSRRTITILHGHPRRFEHARMFL